MNKLVIEEALLFEIIIIFFGFIIVNEKIPNFKYKNEEDKITKYYQDNYSDLEVQEGEFTYNSEDKSYSITYYDKDYKDLNFTIKSLNNKIKSLQESLDSKNSKDNTLVESLKTELTNLKHDSQIKNSQYVKKLNESNETVLKYKKIAKIAVDKYIECKSTALGISADDVKSRLNESFSFKEIDNVCESLRGYNLNISKLPFQLSNVKNVSMKENLQQRAITNPDDVVDKSILDYI